MHGSHSDNHMNRLILAKLDEIKQTLRDGLHRLEQRMHAMGSSLDSLQSAVAAESTVIDSAVQLIQGLAAQVAALQPTQEAIDALAANIKAKSDALAAAVTANTPVEAPVAG
jgi:peptidoglycan hydrolase CwlO-like protein